MKHWSNILCLASLGLIACGKVVPVDTGDDPVATGPVGPGGDTSPGRPGGGAESFPTPPPATPTTPPTPPTSFPWVAGCPAAPVEDFVPAAAPAGSVEDLQAYAAAVRASFVGHWTGQQSIFGTTPPVAFSFESDGHYAGICLASGCWATIYNGTDNESAAKRYRLDTMSVDGVTSGTIDLAFPPQPAMGEDPNDPPYVPAVGTNVLQKVVLDASGNRLRFDLVSYMQAPPFVAHYELWRCPSP